MTADTSGEHAPGSSVGHSTFRVTVRGRFGELTDRAHQYLVGAVTQHDIFVSAFTEEGTFTYDERIAFFNVRYEVAAGGDNPSVAAEQHALAEAEAFLQTMGFAHRGLRASVADMSAMWAASDRRLRGQ